MYRQLNIVVLILLAAFSVNAQEFYFGADQSYVNELEDCGAVYFENHVPKDVHQIFADHGCNLVRLRLWHTPAWYDELNEGRRYSDLDDIKKSIRRAKVAGMHVLLDFHLSDNWADPSKQIIPKAWEPVADAIETLEDSLYQYIYSTLTELNVEGLLPEMVQIGNETNRGILLTPEQNETWTLDWARNSRLFNAAIRAIRTLENEIKQEIKIALHFAAPEEIEWYVSEATKNTVQDFDIIAMSYYWAWHAPTTIETTGEVIRRLKANYTDKEVIVVETGYPWTLANNDNAPNIINKIDASYGPASPESQKAWLIDLTQEVINSGGLGVVYWEPSWVSTNCWNQWNQGSHQDHATFFDFENNLLIPGGIEFMAYDYENLTTSETSFQDEFIALQYHSESKAILLEIPLDNRTYQYSIFDSIGRRVLDGDLMNGHNSITLGSLSSGNYFLVVYRDFRAFFKRSIIKP